MSMTEDIFRNRLDQLIDLRHPLAVLVNRLPWQEDQRRGYVVPTQAMAGAGVSNAGRPRLPTRLMVSLLYLKHALNESDEDVIQRWVETPTWQYLLGNEYFEFSSCRPMAKMARSHST